MESRRAKDVCVLLEGDLTDEAPWCVVFVLLFF